MLELKPLDRNIEIELVNNFDGLIFSVTRWVAVRWLPPTGNEGMAKQTELVFSFFFLSSKIVSHIYFVYVGIVPRVGEDVKSCVQFVEHADNSHDSVGAGIASA